MSEELQRLNAVWRYPTTVYFGVGQQQKALNDVAQFAHIPRPGIAFQLFNGFRRKQLRLPGILLCDLPCKMPDQDGNILHAVPQRRKHQRENVNPQ